MSDVSVKFQHLEKEHYKTLTVCSALPNSTMSIPNSICAMFWSASPTIRSTGSTNSCLGTWPQCFQRTSLHPKCPHKKYMDTKPPLLYEAAFQDGLETTLTLVWPRFSCNFRRRCFAKRYRPVPNNE